MKDYFRNYRHAVDQLDIAKDNEWKKFFEMMDDMSKSLSKLTGLNIEVEPSKQKIFIMLKDHSGSGHHKILLGIWLQKGKVMSWSVDKEIDLVKYQSLIDQIIKELDLK